MLEKFRTISFLIACVFALLNLRYGFLISSTHTDISRDNRPLFEDDLSSLSETISHREHAHFNLTECMLKLKLNVTPLIIKWDSDGVPIPYSVKIVDKSFYVLLSLLDDRFEWREDPYKYACNDERGAEILSHKRVGKSILIVRCPLILDPSKEQLSTLSIYSGIENKTMVSYDLSMHDECERKDIEYMAHLDSPKIGITAAFKGNRKKAAEWAAYHHLIGFDHIWLYVNDDWDDGKDLLERDYITWIPYNFHVESNGENKRHHFTPWEFFRIASMNDALWRAKRMGLDWLSFIDIDEYIHIPPAHNPDNNGNSTILISNYLSNKTISQCMSIEMTSAPFGSDKNTKHEGEPDLVIDYAYRKEIDINDKKRDRVKLIVNTHDVTSINIHFVGGDTGIRKCRLLKLKGDETRVNHYKNPEKGVFPNKKNTPLVRDTTLIDKYRSLVIKELQPRMK